MLDLADYEPDTGEPLGSDVDIVQFTKGISIADLSFSRAGEDYDDLVVTFASSIDRMVISQAFYHGAREIEEFRFADGSILSIADVKAALLTSTANDDILIGYSNTSETLDGGARNDYLDGRGGEDTYVFGIGYGQDIVVPGDQSIIRLLSGVLPTDVVLSRSETNDDVILKVTGTNDTLTIQGGDYISEIQFADGTIWDRQYVMSVLMTGTPADDRLIGTAADDVLDGGAGNDYLDGRAGKDTYVFGLGYGNDVVNDPSDANVLHLNAGVTPADVVLSLGGSENLDVILSIEGTPDTLTFLELLPAYRSSGDGITEIHFSDGTVWDAQTITSKFIDSTPGDDVIVGFWTSDKIDAGAGNDVLSGGLGADSLIGGSGDDTLDGQADKDWFAGAEGNDVYVVNEAGEVTLENADEGLDLVSHL